MSGGSVAGAQQVNETPRPAGLSFLEALGVPLSRDAAAVEGGDVMVWPIASADRDEVALVGLVRVAVPRDFSFARTANVTALRSRPGREAFGVLSTPPVLADLAAMRLEASDADRIRKCRVAHCAIKLPEREMTAMASALASRRQDDPATVSQVDSLMREWLLGLVTDYLARGDAALLVYDDTRPGDSPRPGFVSCSRRAHPCFAMRRRSRATWRSRPRARSPARRVRSSGPSTAGQG